MNKTHSIIGALLYFLAAIIICGYFLIDITHIAHLSPTCRILLLVAASILMYIGCRTITRHNTRLTILYQLNFIIWFLLYLTLLITLTQLDSYSYRDDSGKYIFYESRPLNFLPFSTIYAYIFNFTNGYIPLSSFLYNIIGNVIALMPLAFFLPLLFQSQNHFPRFFITIIIITAIIELVQFIIMSGTCDIDDFILNVSGACLAFFVFQIQPIKQALQHIFLPPTPALSNSNTTSPS